MLGCGGLWVLWNCYLVGLKKRRGRAQISWGGGRYLYLVADHVQELLRHSLGHIFFILHARCHERRVPRLEERGGHMFLILYARYHKYFAAYVCT